MHKNKHFKKFKYLCIITKIFMKHIYLNFDYVKAVCFLNKSYSKIHQNYMWGALGWRTIYEKLVCNLDSQAHEELLHPKYRMSHKTSCWLHVKH